MSSFKPLSCPLNENSAISAISANSAISENKKANKKSCDTITFDINNKPTGIKRLYLATLNSSKAFKWLFKNESAFKQELLLLLIATPATFFFDISIHDQIILLLAIVFIIFTEIMNTAIEAVVDRIGLEIHPLSGLAKDLGSLAVAVSIVIAIGVWFAVLI